VINTLSLRAFLALLLTPLVLTSLYTPMAKYPVIINKYEVRVVFQNLHVKTNGGKIVLNGTVSGVLEAKYIFHKDEVIVSTRYLEYRLKDFEDKNARTYIEHALSGVTYNQYRRDEPPYSVNKAFIIEGGIKYYVSPLYLLSNNLIEQHLMFPLGNHTYIVEDRFFTYDRGSGILIGLNITSDIKVNKTIYTHYCIWFKLVDSNKYSLLYQVADPGLLLLITIVVYTLILVFPKKTKTSI